MNEEITEDLANQIQMAGIERVKIRSGLTCESRRGICARCYGRDLATGRMAERGQAVGVIAAQSIGEPGTQLTMRTFHVGGIARGEQHESALTSKSHGVVKFVNLTTVKNKTGDLVVMNRNGHLVIHDHKGRELERHPVVYGSTLKVHDGELLTPDRLMVEWDPYAFAILTEIAGEIAFRDIIDGVTMKEEVDELTGFSRKMIVESQDEKKHPQFVIKDSEGRSHRKPLPVNAILMVEDGQKVHQGDTLAKIPRETTKTKDITGGLPRVVELFEARHPKEPAVITEIDGVVKYGEIVKGERNIYIIPDEGGEPALYKVRKGVHVNVLEGERLRAGDALIDGPVDPHDILRVKGEAELQRYLVDQIQEVYRLQGVTINDKHIEVIVRQMMRWVKIEEVGDTGFILDEQVDKFRFQEENDRVMATGVGPARGRPLLLGITKASLATDSFISAASFQETTRVLTEASISGRVDFMRGLKENVIMGRLIPAGTGMDYYRQIAIAPEPIEPEAGPDEVGFEAGVGEEGFPEALVGLKK